MFRKLDERRFDPPREVLVLADDEWWPAEQSALGRHMLSERVRLAE